MTAWARASSAWRGWPAATISALRSVAAPVGELLGGGIDQQGDRVGAVRLSGEVGGDAAQQRRAGLAGLGGEQCLTAGPGGSSRPCRVTPCLPRRPKRRRRRRRGREEVSGAAASAAGAGSGVEAGFGSGLRSRRGSDLGSRSPLRGSRSPPSPAGLRVRLRRRRAGRSRCSVASAATARCGGAAGGAAVAGAAVGELARSARPAAASGSARPRPRRPACAARRGASSPARPWSSWRQVIQPAALRGRCPPAPPPPARPRPPS